MTHFMRATDAFAWGMESDPGLRSTVVTVLLLATSPDWDEIRHRFDRLAREVPMFRQRVVSSPAPAPPRWEDDPDFDLGFHLRRVAAPRPGSLDEVLDMARVAEMEDLDRARPLWKATLIDGLGNGAAAVLCTFHHSLTDGIGGVQIAMILFDVSAHPQPQPTPPPQPQPPGPAWPLGTLVGSVPGLILNGIRRPLPTIRSAIATAASVYRTVRPINTTGSPLMKDRSLIRRLGVHAVPRPQLLEAAHRCGGSLNDAFLAGVAGGLRRYHDKHHVRVGDLHLTMPVNLRTQADEMGGNRITLMRFDVPVGLADPAERIRQIHDRVARVRHEKSLPYTQWIYAGLNLMPRRYIGSILRHVDFLASDVPGVPVPVFLGGAAVRSQYAFGPTIGSAVNITLLSYVDTCALGIDVDTGAIPDFELFHQCLVAGFEEVLALAG